MDLQASLDLGDDLVGVAEVAELAGVTKAAVANWRSRGTSGFPAPAADTKSGPMYRRSEVVQWLSTRGAPALANDATERPLGIEAALWATADRLRGSIDASQYRHLVLALLFLRYATGAQRPDVELPQRTSWDEITRVSPEKLALSLDRAVARMAEANPDLAPALVLSFRAVPIDSRRLAGLVEVLGRVPVRGDDDDRDLLGRAYEYFLGRFASLEGRNGGEFYTPASVVQLLVEVLEPTSGAVYDPCCGSGGMFIQSARFRAAHSADAPGLKLFGQELNAGTRRLALMNLGLHGLCADLGGTEADTFHADLHKDLRADFVLANPPFNISDWGVDSLVTDVRWKYGVPPNSNANLAWIQHIVWHLNDTGRAGIVLANGSLTSDQPAEQAIRQGLVDDDLIACMVALPGQLFYSTTIPVTLWFIDRAKPKRCRGQVLFIDAKGMGRKVTRTHRILSSDDIGRIAGAYQDWRKSGAVPAEDAAFATAASLATVAANEYSLSPSRYVAPTANALATGSPTLPELAATYATLAHEACDLDARILKALQR
jgi:type I restriction enzyme M protein